MLFCSNISSFSKNIQSVIGIKRKAIDRQALGSIASRSMSSQHLKDLDRRYVWHPFTQMMDYEQEDPLIITDGEGSYLIDSDGKRYIDGVSSLWVTVHGHRHPTLDAALKAQINRIAHSTLLGLSNEPAVFLAEQLVAIAPDGLEKVFYSDSGSTAVEIAVKIAYQYFQQTGAPKKTRFLNFSNAYHGDTLGSVSVGGIDLFHAVYKPLLFETITALTPDTVTCPHHKLNSACTARCFDLALKPLYDHGDQIAAVVIEPRIQGAAGMRMQPDGFLRRLRQACDEVGALLIFDEVATGFGRTGNMFASEHENVSPDMMCVAKGITGGYLPLAATLTTQKIYDGFKAPYRDLKTFFHGHTYTGNPLAAAVALANLELFRDENTLALLQPKITQLKNALKTIAELKHVASVRQCGFMVGIDLMKNRTESYPLEDKIGIRVILEARKHGVIIRPLGNVIVLMPPLSISSDELHTLCSVVQDAIIKTTEGRV